MRNYQARNFMRQMQPGDGVLFYHSSTDVPGIAGIAEVATRRVSRPDPVPERSRDYFDPKSDARADRAGGWSTSRFERKLRRACITLDDV